MKETGLADELAFDQLNFLTETIPPQGNKKILGLYFPEGERPNTQFGPLPPSTIILPADANVETLLHELGHRHGDYYYNDISEEYAENYRMKHSRAAKSYARSMLIKMPRVCIGCPGYPRLCPYCDYGGWF